MITLILPIGPILTNIQRIENGNANVFISQEFVSNNFVFENFSNTPYFSLGNGSNVLMQPTKLPLLTTLQMNAISTPDQLIIFNTDLNKFAFNDGNNWLSINTTLI